jgi:ribonuclease BN (tRNA processing enzyme)
VTNSRIGNSRQCAAGPLTRLRYRVIKSSPLLALVMLLAQLPAQAQEGPFCGEEGVWIQILGAGGPELNDGQAGSSYIVWIDNKARLLIDTGPGASVHFDRAGADFADLDAIAYTQLRADHSSDFPALIQGSASGQRDRPLPVLGPNGNDLLPDVETFVSRMIGPEGVYPDLAEFLTYRSSGGYKINPRKVPATGRSRWSRFNSDNFRLSSMPVNHGSIPAVAWRVDSDDFRIVFTGDFNNSKDVIREFARDADALIVTHAIPAGTRGDAADLYATPEQLGRIAAQANVRILILSHRMNRTRGRESQSREAIEAEFSGPLIFANDMECWGL